MKSLRELIASAQIGQELDGPIPSEDELRTAERELGFRLPNSYREFVQLGGLGGLRLSHRILAPDEIIESLQFLGDRDHVPFADNGCGDLYCWHRTEAAEPMVFFADHETGEYLQDSASFRVWLEKNLF